MLLISFYPCVIKIAWFTAQVMLLQLTFQKESWNYFVGVVSTYRIHHDFGPTLLLCGSHGSASINTNCIYFDKVK